MKKLAEWIQLIVVVAAVAGGTFWLYVMQAEASDTKKTVDNNSATLKQVTKIAEALRDPNRWLRDYLNNHDVDSAQARQWSVMPKGPVRGSKKKQLAGIPYLQKHGLPEVGIMLIWTGDSTKVLDTLWTFPKTKKK